MGQAESEAAIHELMHGGKVYPEDIAPVVEYIKDLEAPKPPPEKAKKRAKR